MKTIGLSFIFCLLGTWLFAQNTGNLSDLPKSSELQQTAAKSTAKNQSLKKQKIDDQKMEFGRSGYDPKTSQEGVRSRMDGRPSPIERKIISRLINKTPVLPTE